MPISKAEFSSQVSSGIPLAPSPADPSPCREALSDSNGGLIADLALIGETEVGAVDPLYLTLNEMPVCIGQPLHEFGSDHFGSLTNRLLMVNRMSGEPLPRLLDSAEAQPQTRRIARGTDRGGSRAPYGAQSPGAQCSRTHRARCFGGSSRKAPKPQRPRMIDKPFLKRSS